MHRREFLKSARAGLVGLLLPEIAFSDDKVTAGNLYLLNLSKEVNHKPIIKSFGRSINLYRNINIGFDEINIVNSPPE
ncbi:hypothetical protein HYT56_03600 [Candidatus Woesearchaeota archaeon]|nr:hypothetical protein [Candidatus Woesearchaeota archaeon]